MKKFLKTFFLVIGIAVLLIAGYWAYHHFFKQKGSIEAFQAVPDDAIFVAATTNLTKAWHDLSKSNFWAYLKTTEYFADLDEDIALVDEFLNENALTSKMLKNRELLIAGLEASNNTWDMVFLADLQELSSYFEEWASSSLKLVSGYTTTESKYSCGGENGNTYQIYTMRDKEDLSFMIHLTLADNLLIISLDKKLLYQVLEKFNNGYWTSNENFRLVSNDLTGTNLIKLFLNYKRVPKLYSMYSTEPSESMDMLSQSLVYSVLNLDLYDDEIILTGNTSLDSVYSYLRAFSNVGTGKTKAYNILSDQTAVYLSLSFNDFNKFYDELTAEYARGNPKDWDDMQKLMKTSEKLLGFSIKDDFLGWIGNEITIAKLRPLSEKSRDIDAAIAIAADNIDKAKAHLGNILTHINKRTPLKFKVEPYRNFEIQYLDIKGFFKMFFGKLFSKVEKPYFTYIEDFVVFANSQEVLHQIIDDYLMGRTMTKSVKFSDFKDGFDNKANLTAYIQTPRMYETLLKYSPADIKPDIEKNKELINSFARFGFQLTNNNGLFKSKLAIQYDSSATQEDIALQAESMAEATAGVVDIDSLKFKVAIPDTMTVENGALTIKDSTSTRLYDGNIANGQVNGIWRTYYPDGNVFVSANYMQGYLNGKAYFFYDSRKETKLADVDFNMDKIDGYYIEYYRNGNMKSKIQYEDGRRHGECIFYYENGNKKLESKYKKGERAGKSTVYNEKGKKIGRLDADNY